MVKSLITKLKEAIKPIILTGIASALIATASGCTIHPESGSDPTGSSNSSQTSSQNSSQNSSSSSSSSQKYVTYSGRLQDNETHADKQGTIKIYDSLSNELTNVNVNGAYSFELPVTNADLTLQAKLNQDSYIRTIRNIDGNAGTNMDVRCVPYPAFCPAGDFKTHMNEINGYADTPDYAGLKKWDLNENGFKGIEILFTNSISGAYFTTEQQDEIRDRITNDNNIEKFVNGKQLDSCVQRDNSLSQKHYINDNGNLEANEGWIIVVPENLPGGQTYVDYYLGASTGIINRAKIELNPENLESATLEHEFGHAFDAPPVNPYLGHSTLNNSLTIMNPSNPNLPIKEADIKAAKIIYEDSFKPREKIGDILGTNWMK